MSDTLYEKMSAARLRAHRALGMYCHPECAYCWPYCHRALVAQSERETEAHYREMDLEVERELGPWPSVDGWTEESETEILSVYDVPPWCLGDAR